MTNLNCILVPIDLSEASLNALDTAAAIAKSRKAKLQLLYISDSSFDFLAADSQFTGLNNMPDTSTDIVYAIASMIRKHFEVDPEIIFMEGSVACTIVKVAWMNNVDLIVMGTHGASGYRDSYIGTNTYNVIKYAGCSVLTVPPNNKWSTFKNILLPIRPTTKALAPYSFIRNLILHSEGKTEVLNIATNRPDDQIKLIDRIISDVKKKFKDDNITAARIDTEGKNPAQEVLFAAELLKTDLIVITPSVDAVNKQFYIGPHTQRILHSARVPVLNTRLVNIPVIV